MSRLGGAGAVAPLVTDIPLSSVEEEGGEGARTDQLGTSAQMVVQKDR